MLAFAVALVSALLVPGLTEATLIGFCSGQEEGLGNCAKTVTYNATTNVLTITLQNTSPAANGGFLTADAFDLGAAADPDIGVVSFTGAANFPAFGLNPAAPSTGGSISVSPNGEREFVISTTSGDWLGGGSPSDGIPVGGSATFTLTLSDDISEASLFGSNEVIRFRGFEDGGSDKTFTTATPVAEPGTLLILGAGLVAVGAWGQRHRLGRRRS
jgi:hypothetical protein